MNDDLCAQAAKHLINFMEAMYGWDIKYYELLTQDFEAHKSLAKQDLTYIYDIYLINKERKFGREAAVNASSPPVFDPNTESVIKCEVLDNKTVLIYTKQGAGFKFDCRYRVKVIKGEWRIDKKEIFSAYEKKWVNERF